ncbi:sugar ABC transporter permease [Micromonospora sp. KC606]|uniref:carbohydrate ABC transporter permease n=1 Tax=Micromonospora sp. KC606 TaxID=2530379 RepID=UPI001043379A|nr:sugar ABC transporter permease [Micromonospora sp. KC606]TDC73358.1 sugar ABC transporter permease [Micromonospora sp. KC606]
MADALSIPTGQPAAVPRPERVRRRAAANSTTRRGDLKAATIFLLPALVGFLVFYLWPTIRGVYLSFTDYSLLVEPEWVGTENYTRMLSDRVFWHSLLVTLEYVAINIGVQTIVAIVLAVLLHRLTSSSFLRGVILLPYLVANVVVALVWYAMADYNIGMINGVLGWFGVDPVAWFGDERLAIPTIALVNVWRHLGYTALLIFAGLQAIPKQMYEAAAVDGSGEWRSFWRITLPLLRPVLAMVLVLTVIGSFQIFDTIAVTTKGGPVNATRVIYYYIYDKAFTQYEFGYAATMGVFLIVVLAGISFLQLRLLRASESDLS